MILLANVVPRTVMYRTCFVELTFVVDATFLKYMIMVMCGKHCAFLRDFVFSNDLGTFPVKSLLSV